ncbi:MAG: hypothetical protein COB33_012480 [Thiotrichaceae bacterium]|nr:hypothetical protein [Thiotrichaceae bacterium]MBL1261334.1 hypothetical protein [Thiotrichaceae bacterium]PCI11164.1 MAG: hypothetical protein COB71_12060 [Thiotrichales bacterium]PCI12863.1 MAG: hypothetical protein COB71_07645 [Thiotrichales bacterium]
MTTFVYSCHKAKIDSGELIRLTGIIDAYKDKHGDIALTDQNERLFEYGDQRITSEQWAAVGRGDRKVFWALRKKVGDPIADIAIPILNNRGINGKFANWLTGLKNDPVNLQKLGVLLMNEHAKAVTLDIDECIGNVPGLLSPKQVATYHERVFKHIGMGSFILGSDGSWLFGGTLFNLPASLYRPIWCKACDFVSPGIGFREDH